MIWCPLHRTIGISEGQWRQIEPLLTAFQARAKEQRQKVMSLRMQMIDLMKSPEVSQEAIRDKKNEILTAQDAMKTMVIEYLLAEKGILSKEQQMKFFEMIQDECKQAGSIPLIGSPDECVPKGK
ncbi:MAG: Spy/CpxP family protein refolding chaperone [bacterium]